MRKKVLVTLNLQKEHLDRLAEECDVDVHAHDRPLDRKDFLGRIAGKQGLLPSITDVVDAEAMDRAPGLQVIANFGVGYNNIDVAAATVRGIPVSNTPGVLTDATADLAFALILATGRRVVEGDRMVREGRFLFWAPYLFLGRDVSGKTLGIAGLGRIGKAVARRARGFDMPVLYSNRTRLDAGEEAALGVSFRPFPDLLAEADILSLHVPLTPETRHLIDREALGRMKPSAILVNTSRGPVVDEKALVAALRTGGIAGAGLDVYEDEPYLAPGLAELENVVLLPHVGSGTWETRMKMADLAVANLLAGLKGERLPNLVNPEVRKS
jgi:glyoxylate reductase